MKIYLHIGKNMMIKKDEIIGIFDYKEMKKNKSSLKLLENVNNIINISEGIEKTIIITKNNKEIKGYISNISSTTLVKRNNI